MSTAPEHYVLQALFLPITLFFDISFIGRIINRKPGEAHEFDIFEKKSYKRYIFMIALIIVLTTLALTNILRNTG